MSRLLDDDVLADFEDALRSVGATITRTWAPGLTDTQIDALTGPHGFRLPEEARRWWRWHNGTLPDTRPPEWNILPRRGLLDLAETLSLFAASRDADLEVFGAEYWLGPVSDVPRVYFACGGDHDAPVPIHTMQDIDPIPALPSIGALVTTWTTLLRTGVYTTDANGHWEWHFERIPQDALRLGVY